MKITKNIIKKIEQEAKKYFSNASGCHDWTHVERVRLLALRIGKKEGADLAVLEVAALLHDICRKDEMRSRGKFCHAEKGSKLAERILRKHKLDKDDRSNISHCVVARRFRNKHIPKTIEAKVLYDADKLDSVGAVGMARIFLFAGNAGSNTLYTGNEKRIAKIKKDYSYTKEDSAVLEYEIKLKHIKNRILTKEGRKISHERDKFMKEFFQRFWLEVGGKK